MNSCKVRSSRQKSVQASHHLFWQLLLTLFIQKLLDSSCWIDTLPYTQPSDSKYGKAKMWNSKDLDMPISRAATDLPSLSDEEHLESGKWHDYIAKEARLQGWRMIFGKSENLHSHPSWLCALGNNSVMEPMVEIYNLEMAIHSNSSPPFIQRTACPMHRVGQKNMH